jgi:hypothetical protein
MKEQLKQEFEYKREEAVAKKEPTAFVLVQTNSPNPFVPHLVIESFSMRTFIERFGDEAVIHAHEEARMYGRRPWLIDIVGEQFISEPNAFELAWQHRAYYHERCREYNATTVRPARE